MKPTLAMRLRAALAALTTRDPPRDLSNIADSRGWMHMFSSGGTLTNDTTTGSWQQDATANPDRALAHFAVYACTTQIASDIAKLCFYLMERKASGIWEESENAASWPFFRRPNHYQTRQQFVEVWELSKVTTGNAVSLKERDERGMVAREYILDWDRVTPMVATNGAVWYQLRTDDLSHLPGPMVYAPASEIIHDRFNCLFHPLVGISPLYAISLAANQGLKMQENSAKFFANMSRPSGIITAPRAINDETAARLKREWEANFGQGKSGTAVLGDSLSYEPMAVTPVDAAIVEQSGLNALQICSAFHMPPFMVGIGDMPGFENVQALTQFYYSTCLQPLIEAFETCQDQGLELPDRYRTEFDLNDLLRMDSKTLAEVQANLVKSGIGKPNEARARFNLPPVPGGDTPYLQVQNYSLQALDKRDSSDDPFKTKPPPATPAPEPKPDAANDEEMAAATEEARAARAAEVVARSEAARSELARHEAEQRAIKAESEAESLRLLNAIRGRAAKLLRDV